MKVEAVQCDAKACPHIEVPTDGAEIPYGWLLVDLYQEGEGNLGEGKVLCSWSCLSDFATNRISAPVKRKRRTREQIQADEAAAREEFEATERSMGVPHSG